MTVKPQKHSLVSEMDAFVISLLEEAKGNKLPADEDGAKPDGNEAERIDFGQRVQFLTAATRYLAIKHRIDPEDEKDAWSKEFDKFHGRGSGGKGRPRKGDADPAADAGTGTLGANSPFPLNAFRPRSSG